MIKHQRVNSVQILLEVLKKNENSISIQGKRTFQADEIPYSKVWKTYDTYSFQVMGRLFPSHVRT